MTARQTVLNLVMPGVCMYRMKCCPPQHLTETYGLSCKESPVSSIGYEMERFAEFAITEFPATAGRDQEKITVDWATILNTISHYVKVRASILTDLCICLYFEY